MTQTTKTHNNHHKLKACLKHTKSTQQLLHSISDQIRIDGSAHPRHIFMNRNKEIYVIYCSTLFPCANKHSLNFFLNYVVSLSEIRKRGTSFCWPSWRIITSIQQEILVTLKYFWGFSCDHISNKTQWRTMQPTFSHLTSQTIIHWTSI